MCLHRVSISEFESRGVAELVLNLGALCLMGPCLDSVEK
jgi:hypothetical protein